MAAFLLLAGQAAAGSRAVRYAPAPSWVAAPPAPTNTAPPSGAVVQVLYSDIQSHVSNSDSAIYTAYRVKLLKPEGLKIGNIGAVWNPDSDQFTVHYLRIRRGDQTIDVLAKTKFQVIQREANLDQSTLDGRLTATLQTPDLEVGDELEFAATTEHHDLVFGGRSAGFAVLPPTGAPGAYRIRFSWADGKQMRWQATPDLGDAVASQGADGHVVAFELRDPHSVVSPDGAPLRFAIHRLFEYTQFASWAETSSVVWRLFDKAATLAPHSPVRDEAAKIASSTKDPKARAEAALSLVQDRIRYVYIGLNGGNYIPASADDTWQRRFGDCKAKTALLLALLRELGVPAEPVLASLQAGGGDGIAQRLPSPGPFDHVLIRTTIDGRTYWLDGTRQGDRRLSETPPADFRWVLPLRADHADLEAVAASPPARPLSGTVLEIDARRGFTSPAQVRLEETFRGDGVETIATQLAGLSSEDAERQLDTFWRNQWDWVEPSKVGWRYDAAGRTLVFTMRGEGPLQWQGDDKQRRSLIVLLAGFTPPSELHRPKDQALASAPWATDFPNYKRWTSIIRLPPETDQWRWDYGADPVHEVLGGVTYWRESEMANGVLRVTMSKRTEVREITAAQAQEITDRLPKFNNDMSQVFQTSDRGQHDAPVALASVDAPPSVRAWQEVDKLDHDLRAKAAAAAGDGRLEEALALLTQAIQAAPNDAANYIARADAEDRLGRHDEARNDLDEAWRINPLDAATAAKRAKAHAAAAHPVESSMDFDPWSDAEAPAGH